MQQRSVPHWAWTCVQMYENWLQRVCELISNPNSDLHYTPLSKKPKCLFSFPFLRSVFPFFFNFGMPNHLSTVIDAPFSIYSGGFWSLRSCPNLAMSANMYVTLLAMHIHVKSHNKNKLNKHVNYSFWNSLLATANESYKYLLGIKW